LQQMTIRSDCRASFALMPASTRGSTRPGAHNSISKTSSIRATGPRPTATTISRLGKDIPSVFRQGRGSEIRTRPAASRCSQDRTAIRPNGLLIGTRLARKEQIPFAQFGRTHAKEAFVTEAADGHFRDALVDACRPGPMWRLPTEPKSPSSA
jgi:hypothetical protein